MGATISKSTENIKDDSSENSVPSPPILTPQIRKLDWDPRSPSSDIARTPIEVLKTPITSSEEVTPTNNSLNITEDLDDACNSNILNHLNPLDPRSPTTDFHRTPIVSDAVSNLQTLHNKNLDKVRGPLVTVTPLKPKKISEKVVKKIYGTPEIDSVNKPVSPKLLESSPITIKPPENKRHSVVGLLETNIDFVETDLDVVIQNKIRRNSVLPIIQTCENFPEDFVSEHGDLGILPTVNYSSSESDFEEETVLHSKETCIFANKTDTLTEIIQEVEKISVAVNINKNGSVVNELDRKLTNLIYQDKQSEISPKPNKPLEKSYTPLRDRNMNSQLPRSIPQLKVSDKPTKPSGGASRIPVFKEKKLKGRISIQCENTPPRMKPKRSQWDPEDSIII